MLELDPGERMQSSERVVAEATQAVQRSGSAAVDPEWLDAQLSRLDLLLRALVEPGALARLLLVDLASLVGAAGGAVYTAFTSHNAAGSSNDARGVGSSGDDSNGDDSNGDGHAGDHRAGQLLLCGTQGIYRSAPASVITGEGFVGRCAAEQRRFIVRDVPADYFRLRSAPASAVPRHCALVPVWMGEAGLAVVELAFHEEPSASIEALLDGLVERRASSAASADASLVAAPPRMRSSYRYGFWGKLSHELRSPLNSVLVLSQLLSENAEENLSPKQVAFAEAIHSSGSELLALVDALSDLSKIETNRLLLEPIEMSFQHLGAHLQRAFEPLASDRGLEFSIELAEDLPDVIVTDGKRVRQILDCLLSNAFKFTESGRVSVSVALCRAGWSADHERLNNARAVVSFAVMDTGVGLSEGEQRSILEVFPPERVEARRGPGASGLGLAISRDLAHLLGGDLRVTSQVGSGSTFTLYLPFSGALPVTAEHTPSASAPGAAPHHLPSHSLTNGSAAPAASPAELTGMEILLIDDDVRSAFSLTGILERQGAAVSHAEGVQEALERLAEGGRASALLIDAQVLASGSADVVRRMLQRCEHLPMIALTPSVSVEGSSAGVARDRHIVVPPQLYQLQKPVVPSELVRLLRTLECAHRTM